MSSSNYHDALHCKYQSGSSTLVDEIKSVRLANPDYGYRTVTLALKNKGINVNHKAVLRIMRENNLLCQAFNRRTKKYNSYKGTVGTVAHNRLNRRFKMDRPFQKIVTDVTEVRWGIKQSTNVHTLQFILTFITEKLLNRPLDVNQR